MKLTRDITITEIAGGALTDALDDQINTEGTCLNLQQGDALTGILKIGGAPVLPESSSLPLLH